MDRRAFHIRCALGCIGFAGTGSVRSLAEGSRQQSAWQQWGGPTRNFRVSPGSFENPPSELWSRELGPGHAAIVSNGQFGISMHLDGEREVVEAWSPGTGERKWKFSYPISYHSPFPQYDGPHSTPAINEGRVFTVSIDAQVHALNLKGEKLWTFDLRKQTGCSLPQSGYAASPLLIDGKLILPTIGHASAEETESHADEVRKRQQENPIPGAIALDQKTGRVVWSASSFRSSHSSPILINAGGEQTVVFHGMFELIGLNPADGSVRWRSLLRREAADNVSFTPIWDAARQQIVVVHGYCSRGAQALRLRRTRGRWSAERVWSNPRMQIVHTNAVATGNVLVGTNRSPTTLLVGVNLQDGSTVFRQRGLGKSGFLVSGRDQLLILDEDGTLQAARIEDSRVRTLWKTRALGDPAWTVPSVSNGQLFLRDRSRLKAYGFPE